MACIVDEQKAPRDGRAGTLNFTGQKPEYNKRSAINYHLIGKG